MSESVDRRSFISSVGLAAALGTGAYVAAPRTAGAVVPPKGKIPNTPFKVGHMTFTSGPGAYLGAPALKGHTLAADEINADGGFLGARTIVTDAPLPSTVRFEKTSGSEFCSVIVPVRPALNTIAFDPLTTPPNAPVAFASMIAWRSDPAPLSLRFVTL